MTGGMEMRETGAERMTQISSFLGHVITYLNMKTICPLATDIRLFGCLCAMGECRGSDRCEFI